MAAKKKKKTRSVRNPAVATAAEISAYEWRENLACISTYRILEGNNRLDQFEESDLVFDDAADQLLCELRYFPRTTSNSDIIELVCLELARKFLTILARDFTVKREELISSVNTLQALQQQFQSRESTIRSLAATVDKAARFEDE